MQTNLAWETLFDGTGVLRRAESSVTIELV
jgi:hypothetical protein